MNVREFKAKHGLTTYFPRGAGHRYACLVHVERVTMLDGTTKSALEVATLPGPTVTAMLDRGLMVEGFDEWDCLVRYAARHGVEGPAREVRQKAVPDKAGWRKRGTKAVDRAAR